MPRIGLDQPLGRVQLEPGLAVREAGEIGVGVAVIAELVALGDDPLEQALLAQHRVADHEEGGGDAPVPEHVENGRSPVRIGTVVEGEGDEAGPVAGPLHDIGRGEAVVALLPDQAGGVGADRPVAERRRRRDPQDLAIALDVDIGRAGEGRKIGRRGLAGEGGEGAPEARILAPQPPERHPGHALETGGAELVPAARRVEQPDMVGRALLVIVEAGIAAGRVEMDRRLAVARGQPRLLDRERLGGVTGRPVIAVIGDGRDRLVRPGLADRLLQALHEPGLGGDRAGIPGRPMLVVEHQEEPVGDPGKSGEVPVGIADGDGGGDGPAVQVEAAVGGVEEAQIIGLGAARQLLEIEGDAGAVPGRDQPLAGVEQARGGGGIVEQGGEAGAVPLAARGVLHHRQHRRSVAGVGEDRLEARLGLAWAAKEARLVSSQGT